MAKIIFGSILVDFMLLACIAVIAVIGIGKNEDMAGEDLKSEGITAIQVKEVEGETVEGQNDWVVDVSPVKIVDKNKDYYQEIELKYLGSVSASLPRNGLTEDKMRESPDYYTMGHYGLNEFDSEKWYEFYNKYYHFEGFKPEIPEGKMIVFSYGRRIIKLEYNPGRTYLDGGLMNRAEFGWNEYEEETVYFYEIEWTALAEMCY